MGIWKVIRGELADGAKISKFALKVVTSEIVTSERRHVVTSEKGPRCCDVRKGPPCCEVREVSQLTGTEFEKAQETNHIKTT